MTTNKVSPLATERQHRKRFRFVRVPLKRHRIRLFAAHHMTVPQTPQQILHDVFGYPAFRGEQAAVVDALLAGQNLLVLMPTGAGKSLCYQIPALLRDGVAIVVSPLIALMADQVAS